MSIKPVFTDLLEIADGLYSVKQLADVKFPGTNLYGWLEVSTHKGLKRFFWTTDKDNHDARFMGKDLALTDSGKIRYFFYVRRRAMMIWGYGYGSDERYTEAVEFTKYLQSVFYPVVQVQKESKKDHYEIDTSQTEDSLSSGAIACVTIVAILLSCLGVTILQNL